MPKLETSPTTTSTLTNTPPVGSNLRAAEVTASEAQRDEGRLIGAAQRAVEAAPPRTYVKEMITSPLTYALPQPGSVQFSVTQDILGADPCKIFMTLPSGERFRLEVGKPQKIKIDGVEHIFEAFPAIDPQTNVTTASIRIDGKEAVQASDIVPINVAITKPYNNVQVVNTNSPAATSTVTNMPQTMSGVATSSSMPGYSLQSTPNLAQIQPLSGNQHALNGTLITAPVGSSVIVTIKPTGTPPSSSTSYQVGYVDESGKITLIPSAFVTYNPDGTFTPVALEGKINQSGKLNIVLVGPPGSVPPYEITVGQNIASVQPVHPAPLRPQNLLHPLRPNHPQYPNRPGQSGNTYIGPGANIGTLNNSGGTTTVNGSNIR